MGMLRMWPERVAVSLISAFLSWTATWKPQFKGSREPAANYWNGVNTHPALLTLMLPIRMDTSLSWVLIETATKQDRAVQEKRAAIGISISGRTSDRRTSPCL